MSFPAEPGTPKARVNQTESAYTDSTDDHSDWSDEEITHLIKKVPAGDWTKGEAQNQKMNHQKLK